MSIKSINGIEVLNTADMSQLLGVGLTVQMVKDLGFEPFATSPTATLWKKSDAAEIAILIADNLLRVADQIQGTKK